MEGAVGPGAPGLTAAVEDRTARAAVRLADVDAFPRFTRRGRSGGSPRCGGCVAHDGSARARLSATVHGGEQPGVYTSQTVRRGDHDWKGGAATALPAQRFRRSTPRLWSPSARRRSSGR